MTDDAQFDLFEPRQSDAADRLVDVMLARMMKELGRRPTFLEALGGLAAEWRRRAAA